MRAIFIGAGRGMRLMPTTADNPKCFAEVGDKRILDWTVEAFRRNDVDDICYIGGYQIDKVREAYPQFTFRHNADWENNNILASLFFAEDLMDESFICCYSDILFTSSVVEALLKSDADITVAVDTAWLGRYEHRSEHPSSDAEKVTARNGAVTKIHRDIEEDLAHGEFIGVAKFSENGAQCLCEYYHRRREAFAGKPYREAASFEKAYFIHLLQDMVEEGVSMAHVDTHGGYIEVDTQEDYEYARTCWQSKHLKR